VDDAGEGLRDHLFGDLVQPGGRLFQQHDQGIEQQCAGNADPLALAPGQSDATVGMSSPSGSSAVNSVTSAAPAARVTSAVNAAGRG
jgi:hypothetical protein